MTQPTSALAPDVEAALVRWAIHADCRLLLLFGSAATRQTHARSDLDLAAAFDTLPAPERRLRMIGEIQEIVCHPFDLVFLRHETNPILRFEIFRHGRLIHERSAGLFVSDAVRALALYEDARPFRRLLRERLMLSGAAR